MFEELEAAPPDPILDLKETYRADGNPSKVNLTVGVYQDEEGTTPVFRTVKLAEAKLLEEEESKSYLKIEGADDYAAAVRELLFGPDHEVLASGRAVTAHTPGGTAALRIGGEFVKRIRPEATVWISDPTWPNHPNVFEAAGLGTSSYPYYDVSTHGLAFPAMIEALATIPAGDVVLLHGCCHNPTGVDPAPEEWERIADVVSERGLLPFVDLAYQGLGDGLQEDRLGVLALCRPGQELMIASSFSKNFGLYRERVGALTIVARSEQEAAVCLSHVKKCVRSNYSNPPGHGSAIVSRILWDADLRAEWKLEVEAMCERINRMRDLLAAGLEARTGGDFSFVRRQRGVFSYTGLSEDQVRELRAKHSIYLLDSGRVNIAGLNQGNIDEVCDAIAEVLARARGERTAGS
jgi:aspartate/tyrosine/aromatic aminotransferase